MAGQLGAALLGGLDRLVELALAGDQVGDLPPHPAELRLGGLGSGALGKVGTPVGELIDRRVDALQLEQVVAQHAATR